MKVLGSLLKCSWILTVWGFLTCTLMSVLTLCFVGVEQRKNANSDPVMSDIELEERLLEVESEEDLTDLEYHSLKFKRGKGKNADETLNV